jgi:hypothetical protein
MWQCLSIITATWEGIGKWIIVHGSLKQKQTYPYPKNNESKKDWGCGSSGGVPV